MTAQGSITRGNQWILLLDDRDGHPPHVINSHQIESISWFSRNNYEHLAVRGASGYVYEVSGPQALQLWDYMTEHAMRFDMPLSHATGDASDED